MARDSKWVIDTNNVLFNTHEFHIHTELKRFCILQRFAILPWWRTCSSYLILHYYYLCCLKCTHSSKSLTLLPLIHQSPKRRIIIIKDKRLVLLIINMQIFLTFDINKIWNKTFLILVRTNFRIVWQKIINGTNHVFVFCFYHYKNDIEYHHSNKTSNCSNNKL